MIPGLDSSYDVPSDAQLAQARGNGIGIWAGYLGTLAGTRLAHSWSKDEFDRVKAAGLRTLAFVSGWDDPVAVQRVASDWGIVTCLDVESGIRGDGAWVQPWLDASGSGLYGNYPSIPGRRAPFYVVAAYPGYDPRSTWPASQPPPPGPHGWQCVGTHTEFGCSVDRGYYDDALGALLGGTHTMTVQHIAGPYVQLVETHSGQGYYVLAEDGGIETHGDAQAFPLAGGASGEVSAHGHIDTAHGDRAVSLTLTPSGQGYVILSRNGGVYTCGDAAFEGSEVG